MHLQRSTVVAVALLVVLLASLVSGSIVDTLMETVEGIPVIGGLLSSGGDADADASGSAGASAELGASE